MTLVQLINVIERVAAAQPSVNMVVESDIYRINASPERRYGVFSWVEGQHRTSADANMMNYGFTFFYVDRLMHDSSNETEIQSVGVQTLTNIVRKLEDFGIYASDGWTCRSFTRRFTDECAGVFANVTLSVAKDYTCAVDFDSDVRLAYAVRNGLTLDGMTKVIEFMASKQPAVNMVVRNDIYRLNALPDAKYGVVSWTQLDHTVGESFNTFSFSLLYCDRLMHDNSNEVEIHSQAVQTLENIIRALSDIGVDISVEYSFQPFREKFIDECAGAFARVSFQVPAASVCAESFGDYNLDFNDDFLIY